MAFTADRLAKASSYPILIIAGEELLKGDSLASDYTIIDQVID
jgi:hypothetical protein